ncbi:putative quinol monooxygenase [Amycolatopsis sp. NPDC059027]|uniref:putative quinol monooxygenase n=1 Tax=unclassified Amycolatopsis TaxID=2618356 RepID=UPI003671506A
MSKGSQVPTPQEQEAALRAVTERGVPLFMNVTLTIDPQRRETFLAALRDVLPRARAEETCVHLHAGHSAADPRIFMLSEGWSDLVEYRDTVLRRPYFQKYLRISGECYAQPRVVAPLVPIDPVAW